MAYLLRIILVVSILLGSWSVYRQTRAIQIVQESSDLAGLQKALDWDPTRASLHYSLGLAFRDNIEIWDLDEAERNLEASVYLNPFNWRYWLEWARTSELRGDLGKAEEAYLKTMELNPLSAVYKWRLANFYLRSNSLEKMFPLLRETLETDPSYTEPIFGLLLRLGAEESIFESFWLKDREVRLRTMRFLTLQNSLTPPARKLMVQGWEDLLSDTPGLTPDTGDFYVRSLLGSGEYEKARSEWGRLLGRNGAFDEEYSSGRNLVWNGDFERHLVRNTFGWNVRPSESFAYSRSLSGMNGTFAMKMSFSTESNPDIMPVFQRVIVKPEQTYRLSYKMKTQGVTTEKGFFLEVVSEDGELLVRCAELGGTSFWKSFEQRLTIPGDISFVYLRVRRLPSRRLDNALRGQVWVDDVRLEPVARPSPSASNEELAPATTPTISRRVIELIERKEFAL